jgi:LuxR family transcriptional regulator, maltose regulon positive regulatory protein
MPYYYQLSNGHGMGAEYVMAAERHFNQGDFENAEIEVYKALHQARSGNQPNIIICALFLLARLALLNGDYACVLDLFDKMHEETENKKQYRLIHTIDMCKGFVYACLQQKGRIPVWLAEGDYSSNRLDFPAMAFSHIIYGRVLLLEGKYLELLGTVEHFKGIASVFPNVLAIIYSTIHEAAANERIHRRRPAVEALRQALDLAMPDKVYMPFVENCDYIKPLLEELDTQGIYRKEIGRILEIYESYQKAMEGMQMKYFKESKPKLTDREAEIAQLAAAGFSNKIIGEKLFISENTVKTQLKSVFEKLGVNSRSLLKQYFEIHIKSPTNHPRVI